MRNSTKVYINGRFLSQPMTGVQRYATEVVNALDRALEGGDGALRCTLLVPRRTPAGLDTRNILTRTVGRSWGPIWEQTELDWASRDGLLLNLGSTGPAFHPRQIVTMHDASVYRNPENFSPMFRAWYRFLMPQLGRRAARILTVSNFSKSELTACYGIRESRITVVHNAADHILRDPADASVIERSGVPRHRFLLCVGAGAPNKNVRVVQEALSILGDEDLHLVRVGRSARGVFANTRTATQARVHDAGSVTDGQLRALYENAFAFVFPSLYEGFGIPPLEAMLCGCPVIVSRTSALPETCGEAALYIDPHDPRELAARIQELRASGTLRESIIATGRAHAARFSWDSCADAVLAEVVRLCED